MSRLDLDDRVYANDGDDETVCAWFALCTNPANGLREGPIRGGGFGPIPICQRCDDRMERLSH